MGQACVLAGVRQPVFGGGNVTRAVRADFERGQPARFTRALLRASVRAAITKAAGDRLAKAGDDDARRGSPRIERADRGRDTAPVVTRPERTDVRARGKDAKNDRDGSVVKHVLAGIGLFAVAAAAAVNDPPDLRSWNLLPHDLRVVRLRLRAGDQDIRAIVDGEEVMLGHVVVRAGQVTVLSQRLFQAPARSARVVSELCCQ